MHGTRLNSVESEWGKNAGACLSNSVANAPWIFAYSNEDPSSFASYISSALLSLFSSTSKKAAIISWRLILVDDVLNFLLISLTILLEQIVSIGLGRRFRVRIIEEILNAKEDLLYGNSRFPTFLFI